jgi:two-component system, LytTR family, response regulator
MTAIIRAMIVDDEQPARETLQYMIETYCQDIQITAHATSAAEARSILDHTEIDVLFLDISMPNEDGFDLVKSLDNNKYMFVFVTAYDQFALRAMRASAVDYLQKPIDAADLQQAEEKLVRLQGLRSRSVLTTIAYKQALESLMLNTANKKGVHRLCLPGMQGFTIVEVNDILALDADNNYTIFHLRNLKKIVVSRAIKEYEDILDPATFIRVHKSSIINLKYLKEFSKVDGYYAVMADNSSISVSRRRLPDFLRAVENYNGQSYSIAGMVAS